MLNISDTPTMHQKAYEHIRQMIMSGEIPVGCKIVENDLVKKLGASRGPIRESLMRLKAEGLVVSEPRRGFTVKSFTVHEIKEHYEARELIERLTSRLAAERASEEQIAECEKSLVTFNELYEEMRQTSNITEKRLMTNKLILLDKEFHFQIWQMCGNRKVMQVCSSIFDEMICLRIDNITKNDYGDIELSQAKTLQDHYDIFDAIKCHDAGLAENAMHKHIRNATEKFEKNPSASAKRVKAIEIAKNNNGAG